MLDIPNITPRDDKPKSGGDYSANETYDAHMQRYLQRLGQQVKVAEIDVEAIITT
ncbi:hypothetical protein [Chitinimonas sp. BJB300]|uniref:hypothetical protein n=1 Tax=Chitinimonas sp. BJB300 TaxID=1559339 RepID=UPI00130427BD|nr:hypothetical protein [Chitinimonas sp. BJB300]